MQSIVVFSHLRWNFVFQRPQQLLTRLARHYHVYFIEEPQYGAGEAHWQIDVVAENVSVCRAITPVAADGFHDEQLSYLRPLLHALVIREEITNPIVWFYTPMALPLAQSLSAKMIIYDCMDELSAFRNAPRQLVQRENALLKVCDLVLTGGPSLFESKRKRHASVHCLPSSVDQRHFATAMDCGIEHPEQRHLPHPRLGFFGVIDERLDVQLVADLAAAHPEWQIVMVGPVVKIDPEFLPRAPNIHYFGTRPYEELPKFLAGWDVCLLPFARNAATRYISPTKTLEYLAAEKPIVGTPIADLVELYGHVVRIGEGRTFIEACEAALEESAEHRKRRGQLAEVILSETSWDASAAQIHSLIGQARPAAKDAAHEFRHLTERADLSAPEPPIVVIGAGPTGLSAAYHLGSQSLLLEKNATVGGWCRSTLADGFTFDYAGHIMFSNDPYVHQLYELLLGDNVHWQDREAWIYSYGVHTRYPFQGALFGLPPKVIAECILGAVEASMGAAVEPQAASDSTAIPFSSKGSGKGGPVTDCCADGHGHSLNEPGSGTAKSLSSPAHFEDFIHRTWGRGIAKHFALPYNRKIWAVPLSSMETSWLGGRVPMPNLQEMIEGALQPPAKPMGPNARFGYPLRGGFQALMDGFLPHLEGPLRLEATVAKLIPSKHRLQLKSGEIHSYRQLISTMPLPLLIQAAGEEAPASVRRAARELKHVSVRCVNLGIDRARLSDMHWIYYPEDTVFHRIFLQGNASPHCSPAGAFGLTCEITYSPDKPLPCDGESLIDRCISDAIAVGLISDQDGILSRTQVDMPYAYVVYDHARRQNVATIRDWAQSHDIMLAGRYSEWEYYNSDHAFIAGKNAAEQAMTNLAFLNASAGIPAERLESSLPLSAPVGSPP